ncbi:MAG: hypothetical protein AAGA25_08575 [Planctomycetota bacterium]
MDGIGEAFGEFLVALFLLPFKLVMAALGLVELLLNLMGFSVEILANQPAEGESRFSAARLGTAALPWVLIAVVGPGTYYIAQWRQNIRQQRIADTRQLVIQQADLLAVEDSEAGGFAPLAATYVVPTDAWGNSLRVEFSSGTLNHILTVTSNGPNEEIGGLDDIVERRYLSKPKTEAALNVGRALWNAFRKDDPE